MKKVLCLLFVCIFAVSALSSCIDIGAVIDNGGNDNQPKSEPELSVEYVYSLAKAEGYSGTLEKFIKEFKGEDGEAGADGVGIASAVFNSDLHLILVLTNGKQVDCGEISVNVALSSAISIGTNGNWYINGEDTGRKAEAKDSTEWHTGAGAPPYSIGKEGDLYLNTNTNDVFKKVNGVWSYIANISGKDVTVNEGDDVNVTINPDSNSSVYAASKALLSAVRVEAVFSGSSPLHKQVSNGSGVIYKLDRSLGDAYVITNYHVVYAQDGSGVFGVSNDIALYLYGMEYADFAIDAEYVGGSMNYDIAVLKVRGSELLKSTHVEAADIADSAKVNILDTAIAVGNPESEGISVTKGSVNVLSEDIELLGPDKQTTISYRVMRMDTPVNSGNSGGGLFSDKGELIGIVSAKESECGTENMGYAIPSNLAVAVAENIIRNCDGKTNKNVIKCIIGIGISIGDIRREYDSASGILKVIETCIVAEINPGSVAESSLVVNDVIKSFEIDGVTYEINHTYDGGEALLYASPDSVLYMNIERAGVLMKVRIYISESNFSPIV